MRRSIYAPALTALFVALALSACASSPMPSATKTAPAAPAAAAAAAATTAVTGFGADRVPAGQRIGRDWTKVDSNGDGYVSAAEMEAWLKANPVK